MMAASGNTPDGTPNVARRLVFNESACDTCHDRLGTSPNFRTGGYSARDVRGVPYAEHPADSGGWAAWSKVWVHIDPRRERAYRPVRRDRYCDRPISRRIRVSGGAEELHHLPSGCRRLRLSARPSTRRRTRAGRRSSSNMLYVTAASGSPKAGVHCSRRAAPVGSGNYALALHMAAAARLTATWW